MYIQPYARTQRITLPRTRRVGNLILDPTYTSAPNYRVPRPLAVAPLPYRKRQYTGPTMSRNPNRPRPEVKYYDRMGGLGPLTNPPVVGTPFTPDTGTSPNQVLGNSVTIKSVDWRFSVKCGPGVDGAVPAMFRVMILYDKQANSVAPVPGIILQNPTDVFSFNNLQYRERFIVLSNEIGTVNPLGQDQVFREGHCKVNMPATWSTFPGSASSGAIFTLFMTDQTEVDNSPIFDAWWRTKFIDN